MRRQLEEREAMFFRGRIGQKQKLARLSLAMITAASRLLAAVTTLCLVATGRAAGVPDDCTQLLVAVAPDWNSMRGELRMFERDRGGEWKQHGTAIPVLFGKNGLAWGTGLAGQGEAGPRKKERDGRAPAGVFRIGKIYTYDAELPQGRVSRSAR